MRAKTSMGMRARLAASCLGAALAMGCGGAEGDPQTAGNVIYTTNVYVSFTKEPAKLPFDPRSARLIAASNQLTAIAGHAVGFQFDAALLPEYQSSFEEALIASIENTAKDLSGLAHDDPDAFAATSKALKRVACAYDAVITYEASSFVKDTGTVEIKVPARKHELVARGAVYEGLQDAYEAELTKRFANATDVAPEDEAAFFRWLTRVWKPKYADLATPAAAENDARAARITRALDFARKVQTREIAAKLGAWLLQEGDYFASAYVQHGAVVASASRDSAFRRAERGYVAWLTDAFPAMDDKDKLRALKLVFVRQFNKDRDGQHRYAPFAFPGLSVMSMVSPVFQAWTRAGSPARVTGDDAKTELFQFVMCPYEPDPQGGHSMSPRCDHDLYRYVLDSSESRNQLLAWVSAANDAFVAESTIRNYLALTDTDRRDGELFFWRGLEPNDAMWTAATKALAEEVATSDDGTLLDEARRLWKAYPERRGTVAYLLAHLDEYDHGKVPWQTWSVNSGGGTLTARDLMRYASHGPRALALLHVVWPLLGRGYSRLDALSPTFDAFMADNGARRYRQRDPYLFQQDLMQGLCAEHATDDLAKQKAYLTRWTLQHPSDEKVYTTLIDDIDKCMRIKREAPSRAPVTPLTQGVHVQMPRAGTLDGRL